MSKNTDVVNLVYSKGLQSQSSAEKMPETEASVTTQGLSFTLPQRKGRSEGRVSETMVKFAKWLVLPSGGGQSKEFARQSVQRVTDYLALFPDPTRETGNFKSFTVDNLESFVNDQKSL